MATLGPLLTSLSSRLPWWLRWQRICLQYRRPGFDLWAGKIPWSRKWLPAIVFLLGKFHGEKRWQATLRSQRVGPNWVEQQKLISHILGITVLGCLGFHVLESLILSFFELFQQEAKFLSLHLDQKQKYHIILPLLTYGCSSPFLNCEVFNSTAVISST